MKRILAGTIVAVVVSIFLSASAGAETTECTNITTVPFTITAQGVYCLKQNLGSAMSSGNAIEIQTNNVTIDFNGFKLGNLAASSTNSAYGVYALDRANIVLRNGNIRGFKRGIHLEDSTGESKGHVIEDNLLDTNYQRGIQVEGSEIVVRNNRIRNMTGTNSSIVGIHATISESTISGNQILNLTDNSYGNSQGIWITGDKITVSGNNISDVFGDTAGTGNGVAQGIYIDEADLVLLDDNVFMEISGTTPTLTVAVFFYSSTNSTAIGNKIINSTTAEAGIDASLSSGINCINNLVAGFTTAISNCDFLSGNRTP